MANLEIKKLPGSEVEIVGEIPAGDFENCREQAVKLLSQEIKLDGFRPGNVPEKILAEKIGEGAIMEAMAEIAIQKAYPQIIKENKIFPIGRPEVFITKIARNNPLGFKIKTAVVPEINLPDYKNIASKIEKNEAGDSEDEKIKARERRRIEIIEEITKSTKMEIPKILLETGEKRGEGKDAEKRIKFSLILNEIAKIEKLSVPEEKLKKETSKIIDYYKKLGHPASGGIDEGRVRDYAYGILLNESVFQFLESC